MRIIYILLSVCILTSCRNTIDSTTLSNKELEEAIDLYIAENPLDLPIENNLYKNGFSYPSYHIYFRQKDKDTIMSIIQFSHLNDFEIESDTTKNKDEKIFKSFVPDGFFIYKEKYPLIIFGSDLYSGGNDLKKLLTKTIPDSLRFNEENYHIDFVKWDYKIHNKNCERIIR